MVECQLPKLDVEGSNPFARLDLRQVPILAVLLAAQIFWVVQSTILPQFWVLVLGVADANVGVRGPIKFSFLVPRLKTPRRNGD